MLPIIGCSIIAAGIVLERLWTLQPKRVLPANLAGQVREWIKQDKLDPKHLQRLHQSSPLGQMLAVGLANRHQPRELIKENIEDTGRHVVHELERYLTPLGTVAAISPLLGLLGTVIGMIKVFAAITANGVGNPGVLAGSMSEWSFTPDGEGTRVTYFMEMEPDFWLPPFVGPWFLKRTLLRGAPAAIDQIEYLAQHEDGAATRAAAR
jgi:hypothetical protein